MKPAARHSELSPRQREVLRLVAAGWEDKEIADRAKPPLSIHTVRSHIEKAIERLQAKNRPHAVYIFFFRE